jgi:hypothetical protein
MVWVMFGLAACNGNSSDAPVLGKSPLPLLSVLTRLGPGPVETTGLAVDGAGNLYAVGYAGGGGNVIELLKITPAGAVTSLVSRIPASSYPSQTYLEGGIAVDTDGNLYVGGLDYTAPFSEGQAPWIAKISAQGVSTLITSGDGACGNETTRATFTDSAGLATDSAGNVDVADAGNSTIHKVTPQGVVTTIAGQPGMPGFLPGGLPGLISTSLVEIHGTTLYAAIADGIIAMISNVP